MYTPTLSNFFSAIDFACANFSTIMQKQSYHSLSAESLAAILSHDSIPNCSELDLFKCVINWLEVRLSAKLNHNLSCKVRMILVA